MGGAKFKNDKKPAMRCSTMVSGKPLGRGADGPNTWRETEI